MSFLDEGTFIGKGAVKDALKDPEFKALKGDEKANALKTLKMGGSVTTEIEEANAFLAAADAARDKGDKEFEFPKGSGKIHKVTLKRDLDLEEGKLSTALGGVAFLASLLLMGKINSSDPVIQRLQAEYEQAEPAKQDSIKKLMTKRILFLDTGKVDDSTPMNEEYNPPEWTIFEPTRGTKGRYRSAVGDYKTLDQKYGDPGSIKKDFKNTGKKLAKYTKKNQLWDKLLAKATDTKYNTPFTDFIEDYQEKVKDPNKGGELKKFAKKVSNIGNMSQSEFTAFIRELNSTGYDKTEIKKLENTYKKAQKVKADKKKKKPTNEGNCGCGQTPCKTYGKMKEAKEEKFDYKAPKDKDKDDIKIDPDTEFKIDLKHLIQKHMKEGKSKEDTIKLTKKLMAKLHNKGEIKIDGTTLIFKEADVPQDTQLALPEPPEQTANFLGNDNMDYEGGMAKSQMLKMKNYAKALCDMIDDETQLEAWVQAKLTKASDYMSSVYHYLDYQQTKNLKEDSSMMDTDEALVSILMGEANLSEETAEQVVDGLSNEDFKKSALMMVRGVDERQIAKFVLSATTLDEGFNLNGREVVDLEADGSPGIDPFIGAAYYLDTGKALTDNEIEALINKYPSDLELGGTWWDQQR